MPSLYDGLQPFSFAGQSLPVEDYEVIGGLRDHVHEYSHQDGGDPEKLGRKLYIVRCTINAQNRFKKYPGLFPNGINKLTTLWEKGTTDELVVPDIGPIRAYAFGWTRRWSARVRSGLRVNLELREDSANTPLQIKVTAQTPASLRTGASSLAAKLALASGISGPVLGLFDALQALVVSVVALRDTATLGGNLLSAKLDQLSSLCAQIDGAITLQDPATWDIVEELHGLWATVLDFKTDLLNQGVKVQTFTVPGPMSIQRVSVLIYGTTEGVSDLLALNNLSDPIRIDGGTVIHYYPSQ